MEANIITDIIIPVANILVTILIGGFLFYYINRRENKDKIKELLIDTFMEYLTEYISFQNYLYEIYLKRTITKLLQMEAFHINQVTKDALLAEAEKIQKNNITDWAKDHQTYAPLFMKLLLLMGIKKSEKKIEEKLLKYKPLESIFATDEETMRKNVQAIIDKIPNNFKSTENDDVNQCEEIKKLISQNIYLQVIDYQMKLINIFLKEIDSY
jgi:hypothetical protein